MVFREVSCVVAEAAAEVEDGRVGPAESAARYRGGEQRGEAGPGGSSVEVVEPGGVGGGDRGVGPAGGFHGPSGSVRAVAYGAARSCRRVATRTSGPRILRYRRVRDGATASWIGAERGEACSTRC